MAELPQTVTFKDDGTIPNNKLPLLYYAGAVSSPDCEAIEAMLDSSGWPSRWRASVFTYHHYHSTAHEVLGVASGTAEILLGGPKGQLFTVSAGDVIVIPAGVGHKRISASSDFLVVGGYPPGSQVDLLRGDPGNRPQADENIARVPMPESDPVFGSGGPLTKLWDVT
mgnify:CR=1 FL=1